MDWPALQCLEFFNGYVIHHAENALLARQLYSELHHPGFIRGALR